MARIFEVLLVIFAFVSCNVVTAAPSKVSKIEGAYFGALVADALTLGSHYEYDAPTIKKAYGGIISKYMAPGEEMGGTTHGVGWGRMNYHPGQKAGDQTDYGEYNILMLEHLANRKDKTGPLDLNELIPHWQNRLNSKSWGCWKCSQTKQTLQQVAQGTPYNSLGGGSNAMSVRSAAFHAVYDKEEDVVKAARAAMFTHRHDEALGGGEFFARVTHKIIQDGLKPSEAIDAVAAAMPKWYKQKVKQGIDKFKEATDPTKPLSKEEFVDDLAATSMARLWDVGKSEPIKVGKASPTEGTLPTSVFLILKYEDDFVAAAKANAMIGGDNAARSVAVGMVMGAYHGVEAIPKDLRESLNHWKKSEKLLQKLPLLQAEGRSDL